MGHFLLGRCGSWHKCCCQSFLKSKLTFLKGSRAEEEVMGWCYVIAGGKYLGVLITLI